MIKAAFFDVGGTLMHPYPSVGEIYARAARDFGVCLEAEVLEQNFKREFQKRGGLASMTAHSDERLEKEWWRSLMRDVFQGLAEIREFDTMFEFLFDFFARAEAWRLYPDVTEVLEKLREKRLILGAISNWDSRLLRLMADLELSKYFVFILPSTRVGCAKPDRRIFEEALRRAGCEPQEAIHVGDLLNEDYEGARAVGLRALWLKRSNSPGKVPPDGQVPTIHSLHEILGYVL